MAFLKDCWYMAGWACDFGDEPVARKIIGEPIVLFRDGDELVALSDVCPHRFSAMSSGQVIDGAIQCPYHGLRFDKTGACVFNPHSDTIPKAARVKTYPLAERNGIIWLWMGAPEEANPDDIATFPMLDQPETFVYSPSQTLVMDLNYELIVDNLMDLSHVQFTHANSLGSDTLVPGEIEVLEDGEAIWSKRLGREGTAPPWAYNSGACAQDQRVNYWLDIRWTKPSSFALYAAVGNPGTEFSDGNQLSSVQILTPISETQTYYFITHYRNYAKDVEGLSEAVADAIAEAFKNEDEPTVTAVADRMNGADFWDLGPVMLPCDAGAVRVRRRREALLKAEAEKYRNTDNVKAMPQTAHG